MGKLNKNMKLVSICVHAKMCYYKCLMPNQAEKKMSRPNDVCEL